MCVHYFVFIKTMLLSPRGSIWLLSQVFTLFRVFPTAPSGKYTCLYIYTYSACYCSGFLKAESFSIHSAHSHMCTQTYKLTHAHTTAHFDIILMLFLSLCHTSGSAVWPGDIFSTIELSHGFFVVFALAPSFIILSVNCCGCWRINKGIS